MNKRLRTIIQYLFFFWLGIFFVWLSLKNLNRKKLKRSQIKSELHNAKYWLIFPVFVILFLSHYIRALRWRLLIEPLGLQTLQIPILFLL